MKRIIFLFLLLTLSWALPKMAVVIDDCGYALEHLPAFTELEYPLTLAVIPGQAYSRASAAEIKKAHKALLIHFPWPPFGRDAKRKYPIRIEQGATTANIVWMLEQAVASVPSADGVNNHMGSVLSRDQVMLDKFMQILSEHPENFYFLDSHTIQNSLALRTALQHGILAVRNDIFLDGEQTESVIERRFREAVTVAEKYGTVVAICHANRPVTRKVLKNLLKKYNGRVEFVLLPEIMLERLKR